jgi:acyl dehydratase
LSEILGREPAVLGLDLVGDATPLERLDWDERDAILYALGVGASDLNLTTENTQGVALQALPTLLDVLAQRRLPPRLAAMDKTPFLHGEQSVRLVSPLPATGPAWLRSSVEAVHDKGADGLVVVLAELFADAQGRVLIGQDRMTMFVRGAGGFGGSRGASAAWSLPDRDADEVVALPSRPEQALIFRLSGDRHPLHSDPAFARRNGFPRPILHGLCTFGFAARALIQALCGGDPAGLTGLSGRFAEPAYPGETLTTRIWRAEEGRALFRVTGPDGRVLLNRGVAETAPVD